MVLARFTLKEGQHPWVPNDEFPNESQTPVPIQGVPQEVPSGTFHKFRCTDSFQSMVRPSVVGTVGQLGAMISRIPDEGSTVSLQNFKGGMARDHAEMTRVWQEVREEVAYESVYGATRSASPPPLSPSRAPGQLRECAACEARSR